jgi:hypothetical protein
MIAPVCSRLHGSTYEADDRRAAGRLGTVSASSEVGDLIGDLIGGMARSAPRSAQPTVRALAVRVGADL